MLTIYFFDLQKKRNSKLNQKGFTLIEIISILILISILTVFVIPHFIGNSYEQRAAADKLKSHIRQAKLRALGSDTSWGINANGNMYWLFKSANSTAPIRFLGEDQKKISLPSGVNLDFTISFAPKWGTPHNGEDPNSDPALGSNKTINVGSTRISIIPDTGFVH